MSEGWTSSVITYGFGKSQSLRSANTDHRGVRSGDVCSRAMA